MRNPIFSHHLLDVDILHRTVSYRVSKIRKQGLKEQGCDLLVAENFGQGFKCAVCHPSVVWFK